MKLSSTTKPWATDPDLDWQAQTSQCYILGYNQAKVGIEKSSDCLLFCLGYNRYLMDKENLNNISSN